MKRHLFISLVRAIVLHILPYIVCLNIYSQWIVQVSNTNSNLVSLYFLDINTGFIGAVNPYPWNGSILKTSNSGEVWSSVMLFNDFFPYCFKFFNLNTGIVGGGFYATGYPKVYKTTTNGILWTNMGQTNNFLGSFLSFEFPDLNTGYATFLNGVAKTTNGGMNWVGLSGFNTRWSALDFINITEGWAVFDSGGIIHTTNSGQNWIRINANTKSNLRDVQFINTNIGFIVGNNGKIFKTSDRGVSWLSLESGITERLNSISFLDANTGYIVGDNGKILKTINSGNTWIQNISNVTVNLNKVFFSDYITGYAVGDSGIILKTTTGGQIGISPITSEIPKEFSLYQNYPNPFNPATNIKFAISKASNVKLTVFDMLGREIETLVNENVSPGTYEVKWDAARFSSGVYFYKLLTNDFIMVKKMSFIK